MFCRGGGSGGGEEGPAWKYPKVNNLPFLASQDALEVMGVSESLSDC